MPVRTFPVGHFLLDLTILTVTAIDFRRFL